MTDSTIRGSTAAIGDVPSGVHIMDGTILGTTHGMVLTTLDGMVPTTLVGMVAGTILGTMATMDGHRPIGVGADGIAQVYVI